MCKYHATMERKGILPMDHSMDEPWKHSARQNTLVTVEGVLQAPTYIKHITPQTHKKAVEGWE